MFTYYARGVPIRLIEKGDEIYISQITIFELAARGFNCINEGTLTPKKRTCSTT